MRRSKFLLILSLSLALVLVCAGACFAFSDYPANGVTISEVVDDTYFFRVALSDVTALPVGSGFEIFNGISINHGSGSSFYLSYGDANTTTYSFETYAYFVFRSGYLNVVRRSYDYAFGSAPASNDNLVRCSFNGTYLTPVDLGITLGDGYASDADAVLATNKLTVPRGYALVVRSDSDFSVDDVKLSVIDSFNFPKISSSTSLRTNDSHWGTILAERITSGASADVGPIVQWLPLNANILGRASVYRTDSTVSYSLLSSEVFFVSNPNYSGSYVQNESGEINQNIPMSVTIQTSGAGTIYYDLVPLSQELVVEDGVFHYANFFQPSGTISGTVTPGVDGGSGSVDFGSPSPGGADSDQPPLYDNTTLLGIVRGFVNSLVELFNKAVDSINVLVTQGSTFMTRLAELFTWLPAPVYAVIVAALVVAIVLGVIKLLF